MINFTREFDYTLLSEFDYLLLSELDCLHCFVLKLNLFKEESLASVEALFYHRALFVHSCTRMQLCMTYTLRDVITFMYSNIPYMYVLLIILA